MDLVYNVWCMIRTQIYLPQDLKFELEIVAKRKKMPISEIVRRAVKKDLARNRESAGETLGKIATMATTGGPKDLSANLFDYLYGEKSDYAPKKKRK